MSKSHTSVRRFTESLDLAAPLWQRLRSHRYFSLGVMAVVILLMAFVHIWQRVTVIELAQETGSLRVEHGELRDQAKKLASEIASLSMGTRIERYAIDTLGFEAISADRLFTLVEDEAVAPHPTEWEVIAESFERVLAFLPVRADANAVTNHLSPVIHDTAQTMEHGP